MQALGMIEVIGYPPAVEAADAALKAANVTLLSIAKADAGIMTVEIIGDVGAVTSAVDAGASSAARIGIVRARHVIPRVESELIGKVIPREMTVMYEDRISSNMGSNRLNEFEKSKDVQTDVKLQQEDTKYESSSTQTLSPDKKHDTKVDTSFVSDLKKDIKETKLEIDKVKTDLKHDDKPNIKNSKKIEITNIDSNSISKEEVEGKKQGIDKVQGTTLTEEQLNKRSNANLKALIKSSKIAIPDKQLNEMRKQELIRLILENQ